MEHPAHKLVAIAVVATLEDALRATLELLQSKVRTELVSIVGEEARFSRNWQKSTELAFILNGTSQSLKLDSCSKKIVDLAHAPDLPRVVSQNAAEFETLLGARLIPAHAERLAQAVAAGNLLLLVELVSIEQERVVTRTLLRSCHGSVETHEIDSGRSKRECSICAPKS